MILSIVIPAYNEEDAIAGTIQNVLEAKTEILKKNPGLSEIECIVVDDGSRDNTASVVKQFKNVRLVQHERNRGYGAALKTGFAEGRGGLLAFLDGDGTCSAEFFADMCHELTEKNADIVIGSRMMRKDTGMPIQRKIGNRIFAILLSWIVGRKITDTASGMRVFKKSILPRLYPLPDGLNMTPAMSTQALHEGLNIIEMPICYAERTGKSKLNAVTDGFRFLNSILSIARLYNPLKFFGMIGLTILFLGIILAVKPVMEYVQTGHIPERDIYRFFVIMVFFITGINITHFGAFMNNVLSIMHRREIQPDDKLHRTLFKPELMMHLDKVGIIFMIAAAVLNWRTVYQYIAFQNITVHWSLIITGTTLFLVGVQLFMGTFLIKILQELRDRDNAMKEMKPVQ
ncbi:glycosyltransferase family 2 protein [bacterium]|nr:glycosyltransferase family 2 protein [bacterium]